MLIALCVHHPFVFNRIYRNSECIAVSSGVSWKLTTTNKIKLNEILWIYIQYHYHFKTLHLNRKLKLSRCIDMILTNRIKSNWRWMETDFKTHFTVEYAFVYPFWLNLYLCMHFQGIWIFWIVRFAKHSPGFYCKCNGSYNN